MEQQTDGTGATCCTATTFMHINKHKHEGGGEKNGHFNVPHVYPVFSTSFHLGFYQFRIDLRHWSIFCHASPDWPAVSLLVNDNEYTLFIYELLTLLSNRSRLLDMTVEDKVIKLPIKF